MITQFTQISKFVVFLINVTGISLILTILGQDLKLILKRIFVLMTMFMFVWVDMAFLARTVTNANVSLVSIRIAWSITPFLFVLVYSFIVNLLEQSSKYKYLTLFSYFLGVIFMFLTLLTKQVIKDTYFDEGILTIIYGNFVWLFFGVITAYSFINFYLLLKFYIDKKVKKFTKSKIKFMIIGLTIFFIANAIFNIICPVFLHKFHLYEFGDYSTIIFISLIAYAAMRHNFFDVKIIATTFISVFLGSFLIVDALIFSQSWDQRLLKSIVFLVYLPFGYLLVRSIKREVKQREKLQELTTKLKDMDKQKDEFISVAAHELRSPLTAIKGYVSMVVEGDGGEISEKARSYLSDASAVNERLIRLVNNMLNVTRIEEGRIVYQMEKVDLIKAVQEIYYSFKFEAERKNLKFELQIPHGISDNVEVDPDRVREVIGNYVSNAIKFTDEGSVSIKISNPNMSTIKVEVIDTGPGITKEEQVKLFNKFYRASSTEGKTIGTGLGLYISKLLVEKFNGKVGLESEFGKGSNFWFQLPLLGK